MDLTGVIIDGAVPRSEKERLIAILDYAEALRAEGPETPLKAAVLGMIGLIKVMSEHMEGADEDWHFREDRAIGIVNDLLPDNFICTVGEPNPGDVIVRERDESDE